MADYRIGIADWLLVPIPVAADGSRRDYWWPKMSCLLAAFANHGDPVRLTSLASNRFDVWWEA